jgi:hypothetical protein
MLPGYPVGDLACDIVDSPQVSGKPWRRIEVLQQLRCGVRERAQRRLTRVGQSVEQTIRSRNAVLQDDPPRYPTLTTPRQGQLVPRQATFASELAWHTAKIRLHGTGGRTAFPLDRDAG